MELRLFVQMVVEVYRYETMSLKCLLEILQFLQHMHCWWESVWMGTTWGINAQWVLDMKLQCSISYTI